MDKEEAEFVRPALTRALAAQARDPRVQSALIKDVTRGRENVRASAIEALGDHKAASAVRAISQVAELDGPLREDAVLALGKIGDPASVGSAGRPAADRRTGGATHRGRRPVPPRQQLRGASRGSWCARCASPTVLPDSWNCCGRPRRVWAPWPSLATSRPVARCSTIGVPAVDPSRAPVALALARLAVAQPLALVALVEERQDRDPALQLLRDGFDLLEDDFSEEQFFVAVRQAYFTEPEGSAADGR